MEGISLQKFWLRKAGEDDEISIRAADLPVSVDWF